MRSWYAKPGWGGGRGPRSDPRPRGRQGLKRRSDRDELEPEELELEDEPPLEPEELEFEPPLEELDDLDELRDELVDEVEVEDDAAVNILEPARAAPPVSRRRSSLRSSRQTCKFLDRLSDMLTLSPDQGSKLRTRLGPCAPVH